MLVSTPTPAELDALRDEIGDDPVVMVNLIKYAEPDGAARMGDYGEVTGPLMAEAGAEVVYAGEAGPSLSGVDWDLVALIRFPSVSAFVAMIGCDIYQNEAGPIREEALERTVWLVSRPFG